MEEAEAAGPRLPKAVCVCGRTFDPEQRHDGRIKGGPKRKFCSHTCRNTEQSRRAREAAERRKRERDRVEWEARGQQRLDVD